MRRGELLKWNEAQGPVAELSANRRRLTNLGTFRAYALAYLKNHPDIQPNMTCMVRQLQTTAQGIPLEIYCFTRTTVWAEYERIQGDVRLPAGGDAGVRVERVPAAEIAKAASPIRR